MSENTTILLVDDSSFMRKVLRDIIESAGYVDFLEAGNGKEAIELYQKHHPAFVFLDIIMPDVNGMDVLREIGTQAKVVVVSAVGQNAMVEEAKKLGALDYVIKPFERDLVLDTLRKYNK